MPLRTCIFVGWLLIRVFEENCRPGSLEREVESAQNVIELVNPAPPDISIPAELWVLPSGKA